MTTEHYRTRSGLSIFLSFFRPHRGLFFLDLACALVVAKNDLDYPNVSRCAKRTLLPQNAYRAFFTVMLIVLAAYAVRALLYFVITYWGHTFGIRVEADIRAALFGHMQELGFEFFDRNRTGQLMSRMTTDLFEITELAHHGPEDLFISLVTIVGALTVMATISGGAPMLGFLGTVTGMVRAFYEMANAGSGNIDITLLSGGIYEAMITTVGGLIVGIIAMFAYNYLVMLVDRVVNKMESRTMEFMDLLNEPAQK